VKGLESAADVAIRGFQEALEELRSKLIKHSDLPFMMFGDLVVLCFTGLIFRFVGTDDFSFWQRHLCGGVGF
jgi:hypothetical protein